MVHGAWCRPAVGGGGGDEGEKDVWCIVLYSQWIVWNWFDS